MNSDSFFVGREAELEVLQKRFTGFLDGYRQNIALIGEAHMGKTSLVSQFTRLSLTRRCIFYTLDVSLSLYSELLHHFCFVVLNHFLLREGTIREEQDSIDVLIRAAEPLLPETIAKIKMMFSFSDSQQQKAIIVHILNLIETFLKETDHAYKFCMVIDEFHQLRHAFHGDVYKTLAKFIITQNDVMCVVVSSEPKEADKILSSDLHLIFGNFERVYISEFSPSDAEIFIQQYPCAEGLSSLEKKYIVHLTAGNPHYLNAILSVLSQSISSAVRTDRKVLFKALCDLLLNKQGVLSQEFRLRVEQLWRIKNRSSLLKTVSLLADGYQRISEMKLFLKNTPEIKQYLNKIVEAGIAIQSGHVYRIKDQLLLFWINHVFKPGKLYTESSGLRERIFYERLQEAFDAFCTSVNKENITRIMDLFGSFKGDTVYREQKKALKLPHLEKVRLLRTLNDGANRSFIVGEGNDVLIAALKETQLEEQDVIDFQQHSTVLNNRNVKKCIVTLEHYTESAKFIAKEHSINLWGKDDINFLLRLYNKPVLL